MKKNLFLSLSIYFAITTFNLATAVFNPAIETFSALNQAEPFVISFGTSMSQTHQTQNTAHPSYMKQRLKIEALKSNNPRAYLGHKDRIGYVLRTLPVLLCQNCNIEIDPTTLNLKTDHILIGNLVDQLTKNINNDHSTFTNCPFCKSTQLIEKPKKEVTLTETHKAAMIAQINHLQVKEQSGCLKHHLPNYRISLEACDVLYNNSTELDPEKIKSQAQFIKQMGNPLLFFHHYANPQAIPDLFEKKEHAEWFANYCAKMIEACPNVSHVCPISQPVAFSQRVSRGTLPPFSCSITQKEYLKNINHAQILACKSMKKINPKLKVLVSHQWKPFKPYHSMLSPWYALESLICSIADRMYNQSFVSMMQNNIDNFDGIALSVYPCLKFNGWIPQGNNCAGYFSDDDALEAIMAIHQAFPNKDIYIVETGCNTPNDQKKREFIDMTLQVCKIARDKGIPIKGVYFWGHTNDQDFYTEWNLQPGSTHFGPFEKLDPSNPIGSINAAGLYIKEILSKA